MEYPKETKGYYFYNPSENKVFIAQNVLFLEKYFILNGNNASDVQLEVVQKGVDTQILIKDS